MARIYQLRADAERDHTSRVGMIIFLGSWTMMFAALFFSYALLRFRAPAWPPPGLPHLPLGLPAAATAVLAASSFALHRGGRALARDQRRGLAVGAGIATGLGVVFLTLQWTQWASLWHSGLRTDSGVYGGIFYLLTCFHALHVLVGLGLLTWLAVGAALGAFTAKTQAPVRVVSMFWHFVGVVWGVVFVTVYLL